MTQLVEKVKSQPKLFRTTRKDYYRMTRLGFFSGRRVELINGKVFAMPPQGDRHESSVGMSLRRLMKAFGDDYWIRSQMSLDLKPQSAPEPDLAVVRGTPEQITGKPTSALLVVEVSDSKLRYDQAQKACLYARNGIADYWILNLVQNQLEVYRSPKENSSKHFGFGYAAVERLGLDQSISPLALPEVRIPISDLIKLKR